MARRSGWNTGTDLGEMPYCFVQLFTVLSKGIWPCDCQSDVVSFFRSTGATTGKPVVHLTTLVRLQPQGWMTLSLLHDQTGCSATVWFNTHTNTANNGVMDHTPTHTQRDSPDAETDFPAITQLTSVPRSQRVSSSAWPGHLNSRNSSSPWCCWRVQGFAPSPYELERTVCLDQWYVWMLDQADCPYASRKVAVHGLCCSICSGWRSGDGLQSSADAGSVAPRQLGWVSIQRELQVRA